VDFIPNFDETEKEPVVLPSRYPNLLVNGTSGIAVGMATNIPPHNLREVVDAVVRLIDNKVEEDRETSIDEVLQIVKGPDFPTGGVIIGKMGIEEAYRTGRGKIKVRAVTNIEPMENGKHRIIVTELPYMVNKAKLIQKIAELVRDKKIDGITALRDESDRSGMRICIELRRDVNANIILNQLYKHTQLQDTFGVIMLALVDKQPKVLNLYDMLKYYLLHQEEVVTRRTQYDLNKAEERAHILEGLMIAVDNLDEVIQLIRKSENPKAAKAGLMERFGLTEIQAQAILDMRLQRLTGLEILALRKEYAELLKTIAELEAILNDEKKLMNVIKKELRAVADQFGDDRRTTIEEVHNVVEALVKEEKVAEEALVTFSREGYLRRSWPKAKKAAQTEDGQPDDPPVYSFETDTEHTLFFFTNIGNCYQLNVGALPEMNKPKDRGSLLSGVLAGLENGEEPVYLMCATAEELNSLPDLLFVTSRGQLKRSAASEYAVKRSKFGALNLREGDSLHAVLSLDVSSDVLMISETGMCIRFHADQVPAMGRVSGGVKGMTLDLSDRILWVGQPAAADQLLLFTERGFGKRVPYTDYEPQARGGKGVKTFYYQKSGSNGSRIAGVALVTEAGQNVVIHQKTSQPTQLSADEIILQSKQDRGMPYVMALMDDTVTGVSLA